MLASRRTSMLLPTTQQTTSKLAYKTASATTTRVSPRRRPMLFPTSEERPRKLANEVSRAAAAAMPTATTLLVAHERVHRKALYALCQPTCPIGAQVSMCAYAQSACPIARRPVGHASLSVAGFWP
jgi:hypothetical protein